MARAGADLNDAEALRLVVEGTVAETDTGRLYIGGCLRAKRWLMGLLAQLFRHKSALPDGGSAHRATGGGEVRDLGAIAAAVGVRPERGMPAEFQVSLSALLQRVPAEFIRPGQHDANRIVRIPAADVAPGLARGRAEVSLARLVALAPDVFRWDRGESGDPTVRLPIQRLLEQIGSDTPAPVETDDVHANPPAAEAASAGSEVSDGAGIVTAHLPSIVWGTDAVPDVAVQTFTAPQQAILTAPVEPGQGIVELRPAKDVPISSTLRAVVLGGSVTDASREGSTLAGRILAPRTAAPSVTGAPPAAGPSIMPPSVGAPAADFAGLQNLFMSSVPLDLQSVAALSAALPGVHACIIRGAAGSAEAGEMPPGLNVEEVRAASEEFARRIGGVESTTIHRGDSAIAIFTRGGVCLSAVTDAAGFVPGVRERLTSVTELLAGKSSTR